jgi:hypothetical protein
MSTKSLDSHETNEGPWEITLRQAVKGLRYGSVEVVVHDGRVVQIETREKVRFTDHRPPDDRKRNEEIRGRTDRKTGGTGPSSNEETSE